jgi:hypothetical protein
MKIAKNKIDVDEILNSGPTIDDHIMKNIHIKFDNKKIYI